MECEVCGRKLEKFEKYIEISIGKYVHASCEDWKKEWEKLPQKIKEMYSSFEEYFSEHALSSLIPIRNVWICMNCIKQPEKVGKAILRKLEGG